MAPVLIALFFLLVFGFFLSDGCIIQFKLAYLPHLPVMALVYCYHLYWLTCPSPRRRASTGGYSCV